MNHSGNWRLEPGKASAETVEPSNVQAWARDTKTGEPVYILELGKDRVGKRCGCECQSCDLALIAVNAAKSEYTKRPHFRHPPSAVKAECSYLAARLAALWLLGTHGVIQLPARRLAGTVVGLSGVEHVAWIERPEKRLHIRHVDYQDKVAAVITLEDGRQLRFQLIGTGQHAPDGQIVATIFLDLRNDELAGLSPQELRARTTLVPEGLCWLNHWEDAELQAQANSAAMAIAVEALDIEGQYGTELAGVDPKFRRETLLHLETKRILSEANRIAVPSIQGSARRRAQDGHEIEKSFAIPSQVVPLTEVMLEKRFGDLIPDATALTSEKYGRVLLMEVTVTNRIDRTRRARYQHCNVPALEIDLSCAGGRITREELRHLVIERTDAKTWLFHPSYAQLQHEVDVAADFELNERNRAIEEEEQHRRSIFNIPAAQIAADYLEAVQLYAEYEVDGKAERFEEKLRLMEAVRNQAKRLAVHGYEEAIDEDLTEFPSLIVPRILSIQIGQGVGIRGNSTMEIMAIQQQVPPRQRSLNTLYLIAEATYRTRYDPPRPSWYEDWVAEVERSILAGEKTYLRSRRFDRLLSLLFPEMAPGLGETFGTPSYKPASAPISKSRSTALPTPPSAVQRTDRPGHQKLHSDPGWLTGAALESWKRQYPESARQWEQYNATQREDAESTKKAT